MSTTEERGGDCFPVAAGFLTSGLMESVAARSRRPLVKNHKSPWRVVHGLPEGTSGPLTGVRHWHAWVEVQADDGWLVIDYSNDKDLRIPRVIFYLVGQLDETLVWRFTPAEAEEQRRRWGHCGPWVDGWEQMGDAPGRLGA